MNYELGKNFHIGKLKSMHMSHPDIKIKLMGFF